MGYYSVGLMFAVGLLLITHETIFKVDGQCTVQGCDNRDPSMSIVDEMQQLKVELFDQLNKQAQINNELLMASFQDVKSQLNAVNLSLQAIDRRLLEQGICIEQGQSIYELLNESFQQITSQHDAIVTSLQAVDRRLGEDDTFTRNQTRNTRTSANDSCDPASEVCDCSDIKASGQTRSGVYEVCVGQQLNRTCTSAFCDMETVNRVSLVFQRRKDGNVSFNRTWTEYRNGFGNPDGEFWLGNEMLYRLTSKRNYKLRIDLEDWEGEKRYAEYANFSISSSANKYTLTVGGYSGNTGDSLTHNSGRQFSTIDADSDSCRHNCALTYGGAWWHRCCAYATLNGIYYHRNEAVISDSGIHWYHWHDSWRYSLKATEMKLVSVA